MESPSDEIILVVVSYQNEKFISMEKIPRGIAMKRRIDNRQLSMDFESLFAIPDPKEPTAGSMDCGSELRHLVSKTLKACPKDRFTIAAEMSMLTGREISKSMLDSWSAESRAEWRFPLEFAPAFEVATGTSVLTEFMARKCGRKVYAGTDVLAAELGKLSALKDEIDGKIRILKQHLRR